MTRSIVVLSVEEDVTARLVIEKLQADGEPVVLVDTRSFPAHAPIKATYKGSTIESSLRLPNGQQLDFASIRSVWNRRPSTFSFPPDLSVGTLRFVRAEARHTLAGLFEIASCLWINPPQAEAIARLKPFQLRVAQEVGLEVPDTLITNTPEDARDFIERYSGNVIYKRLSAATLYDADGRGMNSLTTQVSKRMLERIDQVAVTPCLFQENLRKAFELRVTIVGASVTAARINSQALPEGEIDSRLVSEKLPWTEYDLPPGVTTALRALMRRLDLVFGAIDLVVTPDGRYVFLEVNPTGQWAWFPDQITLQIRDALADLLTAGVADPSNASDVSPETGRGAINRT